MIGDANRGWGNVLNPQRRIVVCVSSSETRFFMKKTEDHLLDACNHTVVNVGPKAPYR